MLRLLGAPRFWLGNQASGFNKMRILMSLFLCFSSGFKQQGSSRKSKSAKDVNKAGNANCGHKKQHETGGKCLGAVAKEKGRVKGNVETK